MPSIKLQSSDGKLFEVDVEIAKCSGTIKTMLEDLGMDEGESVIPLPLVNAVTLDKIIEWAIHHKDDPPLLEDDDTEPDSDDISNWDVVFLMVDLDTLYELLMAANYLDIKGLLEVTCKTVANIIKGRSPDEIRYIFNITNDPTGYEEEQIREE